jgi:hypothetical protein
VTEFSTLTGNDADFRFKGLHLNPDPTQVAAGAVGNVRTVAAFSAEDKVLALFNQKLEVPRKLSFRRGQTSGFGLGLSQFFLYA